MGLRKSLAERRIFSRARRGIKRFISKVGWEVSTDDLCFPGRPLNRFYLHPKTDIGWGTIETPERQIIVEVSFEDSQIRIRPPFSSNEEEYVMPFSDFEEESLVQKLEEFYRRTIFPETKTLEVKEKPQELQGSLAIGWYYSENKQEFQLARIAEKDRAGHFYVIGATGTGKTKFLEFLILQDIEKQNGFGVIDPHGDLIEDIKGFLACYHYYQDPEVFDRVVLIDPTDPEFTVAFNPLEELPNVSVAEQVSELIEAFRKIWKGSWGVRMEDLMRNSLIALGEAGLTLVDLPHFLTDRDFRKTVLERVSHTIALDYFRRFDALSERSQLAWIEPVMNKINAFLSDQRIRQIFAAPKSTFNLREIMDQGKILLVKLDKGRLKGSADLLGSLLLAKIQLAAFSRTDTPQTRRRPFYLYIDEFQNFATESFAVLLSEARKYGLYLILAHQTLAQIPTELRYLILGNTGIQVYFRLNRHDSQVLAKEAFEYSGYEVKTYYYLHPIFWTLGEEWEHKTEELQNLPPRCCWAKHKIEGGLIPLFTVEIEPAWEILGMEEEEYYEYLKELPIGKKYLIPRQELAVGAPRYQFPKEKVKVEKVKERKPPKPYPTWIFKETSEEEKEKAPMAAREAQAKSEQESTSQHRYLQSLIKRIAEEKGFRAKIEQPILGGAGRVDVELEIEGKKIACEISVTSTPVQELANIKKCLQAGYKTIILCSPKARNLKRIKVLASKDLDKPGLEKILLLSPEQLFLYLEEIAASVMSREERIKGYRVKVNYQPLREDEEWMRKEALIKVIASSLQRMQEKKGVW